jgi:hypothetical protein
MKGAVDGKRDCVPFAPRSRGLKMGYVTTRLTLLGMLAVLLTSCAWNSAQQGRWDGVRSAQWGAGGIAFAGMRFDRQRYLSDQEYREGFDQGLQNSRGATWPFTDARETIRHILRLDELRAQAEASQDVPMPAPAIAPAASTAPAPETLVPAPAYAPAEPAPTGMPSLGGDGVVIYRVEMPSAP